MNETFSTTPITGKAGQGRRISVAPMMALTDRHCRYFLRQISRSCLLYTEMLATTALLHGDRERLLAYSPQEHPLALQLGGSDPDELAACARLAADYGYDEVNLNLGCPSSRVQQGGIGACLMKQPSRVASCLQAMQDAVSVPVTVKIRLGVSGRSSQQELVDFVGCLANAGCQTFVVHARIAILEGLSPQENRSVPPLEYERVYQLKRSFPELEIILNGGVTDLDQAETHLREVDGVMLGRAAYYTPWVLSGVDERFFGQPHQPDRHQVLESMVSYANAYIASRDTHRLSHISRHMLGLFNGIAGARLFRRYLSERAHSRQATAELLLQAGELSRAGSTQSYMSVSQ
ncbi:MAG: tRNA dihydrouridine(20/20a) synthase DusA [Kistimonas sp.]|nr:tRNA dihydrouridine(20/20a) synthase DusA [Kistimonas sp.]